MSQAPGVHLVRTDENTAEIEALARRLQAGGGGRAGLAGVLDDLPHRMRRTLAPGRAVHRALTWEGPDRRDEQWWPQGITTSADATDEEAVEGRRLLVVSWYAKDGQGSRVSVVDLDTRRYRHVLLVDPTGGGARPLSVHAGGLAWHGPHLHVAATARGVHTCRLDDLLRVPDNDDLAGLGYRYVLPVRFSYRAQTPEGGQKLRYSFLSLDREAQPPALVVGEYGGPKQTRRLARFGIDPETSYLEAAEDGSAHPTVVEDGGVVRTQGAAVARGQWYLTRSTGPWVPGSAYVGEPGAWRRHQYATPMGPEDIAYWPGQDLLWSVTEHPRRRWVYAMKRSWFDARG